MEKVPSLRISTYFSNLKWLIITFPLLLEKVDNWSKVFWYYLRPLNRRPLTIRFRNREILTAPRWYIFQAVAETFLQDVYHLDASPNEVVVDIGASIGDFSLTASRPVNSRVYAFDPDPVTFQYLKLNLSANGRARVLAFNHPANEKTLEEIFHTYKESRIDLLKIDCEGYEYDLLSSCPSHTLSRVRRISMEIHPVRGHNKEELVEILQRAGFTTRYVKEFGQGPYIYGWREEGLAPAKTI